MKRRPLSGQSGGSNRGQTARDRRDSQASASGNTFLDPLYTDQLGRIGFKISATSPFYFDPAKGFDFRVDPNSGFEVSSASPYAFRRVKGGNVDVDPKTRALVARPTTDDVKDAVGESVTSLLQREAAARAAADSALDARVTALEAVQVEMGTFALTGATPVVVPSLIVTSDTSKCFIHLTRRVDFGSGAGHICVTSSIRDGESFEVISSDGLDDGTVQYKVEVYP